MSFTQLTAPDLTALAHGSATLQLLEGLSFSQDARTLLVRATFTDSADLLGNTLHYGMWICDVVNQQYTSCLNTLLAPAGSAADIEVRTAQIAGAGTELTILAETAARGVASESTLVLINNGAVSNTNVLSGILGVDMPIRIEYYSLSQDGLFLAVQTDNALLAPVNTPDTNEVSDIYLLNLQSAQLERVSYVANSEVFSPVQLGNVYSQGDQVQVAFSTTAAFTTKDTNGTASSVEAQTDAYLWSGTIDADGLVAAPTFQLVSSRADGTAAGFVEVDAPTIATATGVFFSSASAELVANDTNAAVDVFKMSTSTGIVDRVELTAVTELASGASLAAASCDGRVVVLLSTSTEIAGDMGLQQALVADTLTGAWHVASAGTQGEPANDMVIGAVLSPNGTAVGVTTNATNLAPDPAPAAQGSALVQASGFAQVDTMAYAWKSHILLDGVVVSEASQTTVSDASGVAVLSAITSPALALTVSRPISATELAATHSAVNLQDAIAILKMVVGLDVNGQGQPLSPYQALAADFDGNGLVQLTDAIGVLKHVVGLPAPDPTWHFANEADLAVPGITPAGSVALPAINVILSSANPVHVGLVGYLRGDVDGSFAGAAGATSLDASYFTSLVENTQGLELAQFGVYA